MIGSVQSIGWGGYDGEKTNDQSVTWIALKEGGKLRTVKVGV